MAELEDEMPKLEVDAWDRRRQRIRQHYISRGMSENAADELAMADIRREIRGTDRSR